MEMSAGAAQVQLITLMKGLDVKLLFITLFMTPLCKRLKYLQRSAANSGNVNCSRKEAFQSQLDDQ